jgi:outer membrane protein OmpA-like peptidoglycan-associated protein
MNAKHFPNRAGLLAATFAICTSTSIPATFAQTATTDTPLPSPETAPQSRLTVTPSEFAAWLGGPSPAEGPALADQPDADTPSLVTAPPPPPSLTAPPPPAPTLVAPPAPPAIAPTPSPEPPAAPAKAAEEPRAAASTPSVKPPPEIAPPEIAPLEKRAEPQPGEPPATTVQPAAPPEPTLPPPATGVPAEPRVATLPPDSGVTPPAPPVIKPLARPEAITILYDRGDMEVPAAAKADLDEATEWMRQNPSARMQIVGYASGEGATASDARRTSLYRTLAVRKYLVDNGILSTRVNLCAMGAKAKEAPGDKVEIFLEVDSKQRDCEDFAK